MSDGLCRRWCGYAVGCSLGIHVQHAREVVAVQDINVVVDVII